MGIAFEQTLNRHTLDRCLAAWLATQRDLALANAPSPLPATDWSREGLLRWVQEHQPEVILSNDSESIAVWLTEAGYSVPDDIGVVGLDVPYPGSAWSGIYKQWEMHGERAVSLVIDLLQDSRSGLDDTPNVSLVRGVWNPGETVRPQP